MRDDIGRHYLRQFTPDENEPRKKPTYCEQCF